jgi:hypothetical protein
MNKSEIVAKLDEIINSGNLSEKDKNELIQVKNEIKNITYLSEAFNLIVSALIRIFGNDFDFFQ